MRILVVALILLLVTPAATATWMGRGFSEPDTQFDRDSGRMFADADQSLDTNLHQVYFNAYATTDRTAFNPNVGTTGSAYLPTPLTFWAYLGVWKDCNGDGYIGQLEGALDTYRTELLLNPDICPAGVHPADDGSTLPAHNDGEWVREFLWIGPNSANPYYVKDGTSRVWGDFGTPDEAPIRQCQLAPIWTGTLQSTGGMIRLADCAMNERLVQTANALADATGQGELAFDDAPSDRPDQSDSTLNQPIPYGQPTDDALVTAFDCGAPLVVRDPTAPAQGRGELSVITVDDPTGGAPIVVELADEEGAYYRGHQPMVPVVNPDGNVGGTVATTAEAFEDCDPTSGAGQDTSPYQLEGDSVAGTNQRKNVDITFRFVSDNGDKTRTNVIVNEADPDTSARKEVLGQSTPADLGIGLMPGNTGSHHWWGNPTTTASRNPVAWTDNPGPRPVQIQTFYANVETGNRNLAVPAPTFAIYGADHCDGTAPRTGYWACDPAEWIGDSRVGDPYLLLDMDCYDEAAARDAPAHWGTVSNSACDR